MRLTPILFVLFHYPRGCVTTDNTRDKTFKPFGFATVYVNRRGLHLQGRSHAKAKNGSGSHSELLSRMDGIG